MVASPPDTGKEMQPAAKYASKHYGKKDYIFPVALSQFLTTGAEGEEESPQPKTNQTPNSWGRPGLKVRRWWRPRGIHFHSPFCT